MGKLTDRGARTLGAGRYDDGDGLRLVVSLKGKRSWIFRYQLNGRRRDMGLGSFPDVGLKEAREAVGEARKKQSRGIDPIESRDAEERAKEEAKRQAERRLPTFKEIAALEIAAAKLRTTNAKVAYQAERHLGPVYCGPFLDRPVNSITTTELAGHLRSIWAEKPEVARKLYPAIRRVFDRARVKLKDEYDIVMTDNPANWAYLKADGFEKPKELTRGHHPSLAYPRMPVFIAALRSREAMAARLLEFVILTNVRTNAALKAQWREFDLKGKVWTVPLERLKDRKNRKSDEPFRVPLSERAVEILQDLAKAKLGPRVFAASPTRPLSNMAMLALLQRMNAIDGGIWIDDVSGRPIVPHGFRATFRTWAEEQTNFPRALVEEAMGHKTGTKVERAYRRTDILERRRKVMDAWAGHCAPRAGGNVALFKRSGGHAA